MAFTDHSDLFGSVHEDGINRVIRHIMRQRPSLFNYGTELIASNPDYWLCKPVEVSQDVINRGNPIVTIESPLPVFGTGGLVGLNYCFQLTDVEIDFHPGSVFELPPELRPPLEEQHFAIRAQVCGGIGCPPKEIIDQFQLPTFSTNRLANFPKPNPVVIPTREIECFCLELFVVGHFEVVGPVGGQRLLAKLDGLEIVNIQPEGLENSIECYLRLLVQLVLLPRTSVALSNIVLDIYDPVSVVLKPSTSVPNNPAIEEDQLKVFIDLEVLP